MSVDRYMNDYCGSVGKADNGEFVLYSDYETLKAEHDALREELKLLETPPHDPRFPELDKAHLIKISIKQNLELASLREELRKAIPAAITGQTFLPVITDEIISNLGDTELIEIIDGKPQWTQIAVDFCCVIPYASPVPAQKEGRIAIADVIEKLKAWEDADDGLLTAEQTLKLLKEDYKSILKGKSK